MSTLNYQNIEQPYNNLLERTPGGYLASFDNASFLSGGINTPTSIGGDDLENLWIGNWIKSKNFKPKSQGFLIDGKGGYIECMKLYAGSGGIIGGRLDIPDKDTTANSFHVDNNGNMWIGCTQSDFTANNDNADAYILKNGTAKFQSVTIVGGTIDGTSTVGGRTASVISGAINGSGNFIDSNLDTSAKKILGEFTFEGSGALKIATDSNNGVWISPTGIFGKKNDNYTFLVDTGGNAQFSGSISSSTITGGTIQTSTSGQRVVISNDQIEIFNSDGASVGTFKGKTGTYTSSIQTTIAEINVLAMNEEDIGYTDINKDALIGVDTGDLRLTTMKNGGTGGNIVFSAETGKHVISYNHFRPEGNNAQDLGISNHGWRYIYLGSADRYLEDNAGTLYFNGSPVSSGETNTASNKGGTYGWYSNKSGVDLQFKGLSISPRLTITSYSDYLYLDHQTGSGYNHVPSGGTLYYSLRNSGAGTASWTRAVYVGASTYYFDYNASGIVCSKNFFPTNNDSFYLGTSNYGWAKVYIGGSGANLYASGTTILSSSHFSCGGNISGSQISATGDLVTSGGSLKLYVGSSNPSTQGQIVCYDNGSLEEFRGQPGGSWAGKFDMTAY